MSERDGRVVRIGRKDGNVRAGRIGRTGACFAVCAALAWTAFGADVEVQWTATGTGPHDLNDPANWAGGAVPVLQRSADGSFASEALSPVATFTPPNAGADLTLTASADLAFHGLKTLHNDTQHNAKRPYTLTFDLGADRTLAFWGTGDAAFWMGAIYGSWTTVRLASGTLKRDDAVAIPEKATVGGVDYVFKDTFRMQSAKEGNRFFVDGPTSRLEFPQVTFGGENTLFCVTNGGYVKGALYTRAFNETSRTVTNSVIRVSGEGSVWDGDGRVSRFGQLVNGSETYPNNEALVHVTDGGALTNFYLYMGERASNQRLFVDGGRVHMANEFQLGGAEPTATNNVVDVANGGAFHGLTMKVGSGGGRNLFRVHDGGALVCHLLLLGNEPDRGGDELLIDAGGTATVTNGLYVGIKDANVAKGGSTGCVVRVTGAGSKLTFEGQRGYSFRGVGNGLEVSDHGLVQHNGRNQGLGVYSNGWVRVSDYGEIRQGTWVQVGRGGATRARLTVEDHGKIVIEGHALYLGDDQPTRGVNDDNEIRVGDAGEITAERLRIYGTGNRVVLSNGTIRVNERLMTTYNNDPSLGGGAQFFFEGTHPRLAPKNGMTMELGAKLTFRVPSAGYAAGPDDAVVQTGGRGFSLDASCSLVCDVSACVAGGLFTLVDAGTAPVAIDAGVLAAAAEALGNDGRIYVSDDGHKLMLRVWSRCGTHLIIR